MYEDVNFCLLRLALTSERIAVDVLLVHVSSCAIVLILVDVHRMADAENRVILNVGGIRHETCTYARVS